MRVMARATCLLLPAAGRVTWRLLGGASLVCALSFLAGDPDRAAELYAAIGSRPDEADARLAAARVLLAAGHAEQADAELRAATAFWREVGASERLRQAEALRSAAAAE